MTNNLENDGDEYEWTVSLVETHLRSIICELESDPKKKHLSLSTLQDITWKDETAEALMKALQRHSGLHSIYMEDCSLSCTGKGLLMEGLKRQASLKRFLARKVVIDDKDEDQNSILTDILALCRQCPNLQEIRLIDCGLGASVIEPMWNELSRYPVTMLDLSRNDIGSMQHLCHYLDTSQSLTYLGLRNVSLDTNGFQLLLKSLQTNQSLRTLDIAMNNVEPKALKDLIPLLRRHNHSLHELLFDHQGVSQDTIDAIEYELRLNRAGRIHVGDDQAAARLWHHVLAERSHDPDVLFYFLSSRPEVFQPYQETLTKREVPCGTSLWESMRGFLSRQCSRYFHQSITLQAWHGQQVYP